MAGGLGGSRGREKKNPTSHEKFPSRHLLDRRRLGMIRLSGPSTA